MRIRRLRLFAKQTCNCCKKPEAVLVQLAGLLVVLRYLGLGGGSLLWRTSCCYSSVCLCPGLLLAFSAFPCLLGAP